MLRPCWNELQNNENEKKNKAINPMGQDFSVFQIRENLVFHSRNLFLYCTGRPRQAESTRFIDICGFILVIATISWHVPFPVDVLFVKDETFSIFSKWVNPVVFVLLVSTWTIAVTKSGLIKITRKPIWEPVGRPILSEELLTPRYVTTVVRTIRLRHS